MPRVDVDLLKEVCEKTRDVSGQVVEFGVYQGESLALICKYLPNKIVLGLDSFVGLPSPMPDDANSKGQFGDTSLVTVTAAMKGHQNYVLLKGWFADILPSLHIPSLAFVHLDCDHYNSYAVALAWAWQRVAKNGQMLCDDYNASSCQGCKRAVDEFLRTNTNAVSRVVRERLVITKP